MNKSIFITLFFALFAAVTGVGIVVPLLPVYADQLGASGFFIGLIFGAFSLSRTACLPAFGKWSDKSGRKPFLVAGLFLYAVASMGFMAADGVAALVLVRFFQGAASAMIVPVAQAYVGEITPMGKEGLSMGLFNISMFASLSLGPLLGGVVRDQWGIQAAFSAMLVLSLFSCGLCLALLPPVKKEPRMELTRPPLSYRVLLENRCIVGLTAFRTAYTTCVGVVWSFLPVYAAHRFQLSSSQVGVLIMMGVLVAGMLQTPMGWVADRADKRLLVAAGGVCVLASVLLFLPAGGFWGLFRANTLFGVGGGVSTPALMALTVQEGKKTQSMGSVMAILTMGHSLGMLVGSMAAGAVADIFSLSSIFYVGAAAMAGGIWLFWAMSKTPAGRASGTG
ncbi:MAG: MFS transporter [Deltaproteobacteria bacterium]|nr:MFS transporter [Deltaproteobacteria bacterium]